ncbi:hypothetical protein SAV14893_015510 [Streptomyces avermitilis]|uniref:Uncharacterized protein n=1 Tax=Streptomyces avermitilis TaxID=33903 RepID=A0A4D4MZU5_STRAX|nr:hypothetical protein SAVMC3_27700 [Streptomyces avermitilis]GDY62158.1 hypothetical protein SAV14893_015510 [Streptomyces avermitilis]GDY77738.1 hypothetical protein SAV31267_072230 [Streptomyces avermitilis]GDY86616.1 hypothetical protein SAVCW2_58150 [Streptomyces avermitilis]
MVPTLTQQPGGGFPNARTSTGHDHNSLLCHCGSGSCSGFGKCVRSYVGAVTPNLEHMSRYAVCEMAGRGLAGALSSAALGTNYG